MDPTRSYVGRGGRSSSLEEGYVGSAVAAAATGEEEGREERSRVKLGLESHWGLVSEAEDEGLGLGLGFAG